MWLIALTGLVSVEKIQLTIELAGYFNQQGKQVTVVDNIARLAIDPVHLSSTALIRRDGDILNDLNVLLRTLESEQIEVIIFAASENASPEAMFAALADLSQVRVTTVAMIDVRTCDCFPNLRRALEDHADLVVNVPYEFSGVIWALSNFSF